VTCLLCCIGLEYSGITQYSMDALVVGDDGGWTVGAGSEIIKAEENDSSSASGTHSSVGQVFLPSLR